MKNHLIVKLLLNNDQDGKIFFKKTTKLYQYITNLYQDSKILKKKLTFFGLDHVN